MGYVYKRSEVAMYEKGGFRERYAMKNGYRRVVYLRGHLCFKFYYSPKADYQDANGATYDTVTEMWIG